MTSLEIAKWIHLLAAAVWTGGLIVLGFLVGAVRKATDDRGVLRAIARRFGVVSWTAMGIAVASGLWMYLDMSLTPERMSLKWTLVGIAIALALVHQFTAKRSSPAVRGILQGLIMLVSIAVFAAAVTLV